MLCKPRDDFFGHYTCGGKGQKVCQSGWSGENCEKPLCPDGCLHGTCERPGVCQCRNGYKGARCDECQAYPGCKNGFCHKPWECRCYKNWGGILCDKGQWAKLILMTINFSLLIFQIIFSFHWKTFFFHLIKKKSSNDDMCKVLAENCEKRSNNNKCANKLMGLFNAQNNQPFTCFKLWLLHIAHFAFIIFP